ncbi:MAG: DNA polymerase III subunit epsilon [Alphaproteobacteria bacterium]
MREIILDTETTGLDPSAGHRVVEIGCVEVFQGIPTGATFQTYVNPERDMPDEAFQVHGLSREFLAKQPTFAEIAQDFLDFIGGATLVIHNAAFDISFLNAELDRLGLPMLKFERTVDTIAIAKRRFPGAQVSLDALCRRFEIDSSARTKHGALLDAELLADVYLELVGGRQRHLEFATTDRAAARGSARRKSLSPRPHAPSEAELAAHAQLLARLNDPIWLRT